MDDRLTAKSPLQRALWLLLFLPLLLTVLWIFGGTNSQQNIAPTSQAQGDDLSALKFKATTTALEQAIAKERGSEIGAENIDRLIAEAEAAISSADAILAGQPIAAKVEARAEQSEAAQLIRAKIDSARTENTLH